MATSILVKQNAALPLSAAVMLAVAPGAFAGKRMGNWDDWDVIPGKVLIKYKPERGNALRINAANSGMAGLTLTHLEQKIEREFVQKNPGRTFASLLPHTFVGQFNPLERERMLALLAADPEIDYFEPERVRIVISTWGTSTPNDPRLAEQWGMVRIGAAEAWARQKAQRAPVRVGIMEANGPFDREHPDLQNQVSSVQNDPRDPPSNHATSLLSFKIRGHCVFPSRSP
jgi:hypothetical protein